MKPYNYPRLSQEPVKGQPVLWLFVTTNNNLNNMSLHWVLHCSRLKCRATANAATVSCIKDESWNNVKVQMNECVCVCCNGQKHTVPLASFICSCVILSLLLLFLSISHRDKRTKPKWNTSADFPSQSRHISKMDRLCRGSIKDQLRFCFAKEKRGKSSGWDFFFSSTRKPWVGVHTRWSGDEMWLTQKKSVLCMCVCRWLCISLNHTGGQRMTDSSPVDCQHFRSLCGLITQQLAN